MLSMQPSFMNLLISNKNHVQVCVLKGYSQEYIDYRLYSTYKRSNSLCMSRYVRPPFFTSKIIEHNCRTWLGFDDLTSLIGLSVKPHRTLHTTSFSYHLISLITQFLPPFLPYLPPTPASLPLLLTYPSPFLPLHTPIPHSPFSGSKTVRVYGKCGDGTKYNTPG